MLRNSWPLSYMRRRTEEAGGGGGDYAYAENLSNVVESATTYADVATLTFTPDAADYAIFWKTDGSLATTNDNFSAQFVDNGSAVTSITAFSRETTPNDKFPLAGLNFITGDGSTERVLKIQGKTNTLSASATFNQSRIVALKLGDDDEKVVSATEQIISAGTAQTLATLNFTPPSAGDYYIIFHVKAGRSGSNAIFPRLRFTDGTTTLDAAGAGIAESGHTSSYTAFFGITKLTGVSGAQTCTIQGWASSAGTNVKFKDMAILAIRADRFADAQFVTETAADSGTDTSYTTTVSQTFTPSAGDHLTLMATHGRSGVNTASSYVQTLDGAETLSETVLESADTGSRDMGVFGLQIEGYAASSRTQAIQRKSESTNTTTVWDASILCLSLAGMNGA